MSHSSYTNELKKRNIESYERLEFLGDAVLELITSEFLFEEYKDSQEGDMTKLRASIVCEFTLSDISRKLHFGDYVLLGKGEALTGGHDRNSILCDLFESVLGAIYLDGGMDRARTFIHTHLLKDVEDKSLFYDAKTILQEMVQAGPDSRLQYVLTREAGPDHAKEFTVETRIGGKTYAIGKGKTKKGAEQIAAYQTILLLKKQRV